MKINSIKNLNNYIGEKIAIPEEGKYRVGKLIWVEFDNYGGGEAYAHIDFNEGITSTIPLLKFFSDNSFYPILKKYYPGIKSNYAKKDDNSATGYSDRDDYPCLVMIKNYKSSSLDGLFSLPF